MRKVNELYGKRVINQATGDGIATVRDVVLSQDAQHIVALVLGDGTWSNEEHVVRWNSVVSTGEYVIVDGTNQFAMANEDAEISELRSRAEKITGKTVVSTSGERLGTIGDMFFNERGHVIGYVISHGGLFAGEDAFLRAEHVQAIGKDAVIATTNELQSMNVLEAGTDEGRERAVGVNDERHVAASYDQSQAGLNQRPNPTRGVDAVPPVRNDVRQPMPPVQNNVQQPIRGAEPMPPQHIREQPFDPRVDIPRGAPGDEPRNIR